jgi:peptidoglycan/xylan/chitin deacetylase (PgdA/CDA1 family)
MSTKLPAYYSELVPFRALFQAGTPILTYHKIGPRPRRARLKGLYLSSRLFERQLQELKNARFVSGSLTNWNSRTDPGVIVTFDDGYVNVLQYGLGPLAKTGFHAIQFLPADFLGKSNTWDTALGEVSEPIMDANQVRDWIAAGNDIGSHSLSHPYLTRISPAQAQEEVTASRKKLEDLFGRKIEHFCYPYGDWNPAVRDLVQQAGYHSACTTDPGMNDPNDSSFSLKRFTARYPSRNLKSLWFRFGF